VSTVEGVYPHTLIKRLIQVPPGARVAAAEVKFGLESISEGGRREREQVNTGSMVYYNHRCRQCSCTVEPPLMDSPTSGQPLYNGH